MKLLLDTHLLLWASEDRPGLSSAARELIEDPDNRLFFSAASLWEVAIKTGRGQSDFVVDARQLRHALLENDYEELPISSEHAITVSALPAIHRDPFDRLLIAQAQVEGITLLTADPAVARYPGPIRAV